MEKILSTYGKTIWTLPKWLRYEQQVAKTYLTTYLPYIPTIRTYHTYLPYVPTIHTYHTYLPYVPSIRTTYLPYVPTYHTYLPTICTYLPYVPTYHMYLLTIPTYLLTKRTYLQYLPTMPACLTSNLVIGWLCRSHHLRKQKLFFLCKRPSSTTKLSKHKLCKVIVKLQAPTWTTPYNEDRSTISCGRKK